MIIYLSHSKGLHMDIQKIAEQFAIHGDVMRITKINKGYINQTYKVETLLWKFKKKSDILILVMQCVLSLSGVKMVRWRSNQKNIFQNLTYCVKFCYFFNICVLVFCFFL